MSAEAEQQRQQEDPDQEWLLSESESSSIQQEMQNVSALESFRWSADDDHSRVDMQAVLLWSAYALTLCGSLVLVGVVCVGVYFRAGYTAQ